MIKKNINQDEAIRHGDGPCLVLAGPGSGKTYVLTNRVLNLIESFNVDPENILVITFTRAAAMEMRQRFNSLIKNNSFNISATPKFGTFHSTFYEILKDDFGYNSKSLVDSNEERVFLSEVLEKYNVKNINQEYINNVLSDIKHYKLSIERKEKFYPKYISSRLFNKVIHDYQEKLFDNKKLDFSDMIFKCYELLSKNKSVLHHYQSKYKYVLIDEFQDINKSQYDLVKLICKSKNLFVVGDDDQSIYKFRGSRPKVMLDFLKDYKSAKTILLNKNYRCSKQIVKFSKLVINHNRDRFDKDLVSNRKELGKLEIKAFVDSIEENNYIVDIIKRYRRSGKSLSDIAILYRTNLLSNSIKMILNKHSIDYKIKGEEKSIYDNFAIRDILSYLRLSTGTNLDSDLLNIANKPLRYISRDSIKAIGTHIDDLIDYYNGREYVIKNLIKLKNDLLIIKKNITPLAIRYIRCDMGYDNYLKQHCRKNELDYEEIEEILDSFEEEAISFKSINSFIKHIHESEHKKNTNENNTDAVNLMTFHLSKGLEFDTVIIIDSNDGLIPHKKSICENDVETERRLFYVAMTRAKNNLYIFFTIRRFGKDFKPSRFIIEAIGGQNG